MTDSDLIFGFFAALPVPVFSYVDLFYLSRPFDVSENSLRSTLARMITRGLLDREKAGRNSLYSLSGKGKMIRENVALAFETTGTREWAQTWWGIAFPVPDENSSQRYRLRKKLSAFRFAPWQPRLWIRPKIPAECIEQRLAPLFQQGRCRLLEMRFVHGLGPDAVRRLWDLPRVDRQFAKGLKMVEKNLAKVDKLSPPRAFKRKFVVGTRIVNILFKDPLLPPEFWPPLWKGEKLKTMFREWDERVSAVSRPFWHKIIKPGIECI